MKILPDESVGASHGRLGDEERDGEEPVILPRGSRGEGRGTSGHHHAEQQQWLPAHRVHLQRDH